MPTDIRSPQKFMVAAAFHVAQGLPAATTGVGQIHVENLPFLSPHLVPGIIADKIGGVEQLDIAIESGAFIVIEKHAIENLVKIWASLSAIHASLG